MNVFFTIQLSVILNKHLLPAFSSTIGSNFVFHSLVFTEKEEVTNTVKLRLGRASFLGIQKKGQIPHH